ncbi:MAG: hypothetical protein IJB60_07895 [Bacteroidaceae bacterium]|nr:hypothetical protein [Bacteroidaceae bacterium]
MKASIKIEIRDIILQLQTYTYYTGEARKNAGLPARLASDIQASDNEVAQLYDHLNVAFDEIATLISRYLSFCNTKEIENPDAPHSNIICYSFHLPHNYPIECVEQIKRAAIGYAVKRAAQQWFTQCKPDEAMNINSELQSQLIHLREILTMRKQPFINERQGKKQIDI